MCVCVSVCVCVCVCVCVYVGVHVCVQLSVSGVVVVVGAVCWGGGVNRDCYITNLLDPHRPGWGDQNVVILSVQHLLIHALQPHCFGDVGLVVVVPAVGVPGQGGCLGEAVEGGEGRGRRGSRVSSYCRGAPAAV